MLNFRFTKTENAVFISHIDVLRSVNRTLRRMGIDVKYSQGYNPHMLVNLSQPLITGIKSLSEWASVVTDFDNQNKFIELYNQFCPMGFKALECINTIEKAKIAGKVTASDYVIDCPLAFESKDKIENIKFSDFFIKILKNNNIIEKNVRELIYDIKVDQNGIFTRLGFGNRNLRIDKFCNVLNEKFHLKIKLSDITRTSQLIKNELDFISVSEYLKGL